MSGWIAFAISLISWYFLDAPLQLFDEITSKIIHISWYYRDALLRLIDEIIADRVYPPFQHERLRSNDKSFRLVTIKPSSDHDHLIHCTVDEVSLETPPIYDALSYTWYKDRDFGKPVRGRMRTIICNRKALKVHQNLYNGLLELRRLNRGQRLWIDAICIDQGTEVTDEKKSKEIKDEKSAQVNKMGTIFGCAKTVVVWLGRSSLLTDLAIKFIQPVLSDREDEQLGDWIYRMYQNPRKAFDVKPFAKFVASAMIGVPWIVSRGFFERVWTLQEVVLAKEIFFLLGDHELPVFKLGNRFTFGTKLHGKNTDPPTSGELGRVLRNLQQRLAGIRFAYTTRENFLKKEPCNLQDAIEAIRSRKTSKPHDKFFSVLSISSASRDKNIIRHKADYARPVIDVYCSCAKQLLEGTTGIYLLSLVGQLRYGCTQHRMFPASACHCVRGASLVSGLPSWVPDLNAEVRPRPFIESLTREPFAAATSETLEFSFGRNGRSLKARVAVLDYIEDVADGIENPNKHWPWVFFDFACRLGKQYHPTNEPTISAFRTTLVAGEETVVDGEKNCVTITEEEFAEWFALFAEKTPHYGLYAAELILTEQDVESTVSKLTTPLFELRNYHDYECSSADVVEGKFMINTIRRFIAMFDDDKHRFRKRIEKRFHEMCRGGLYKYERRIENGNGEIFLPPPYHLLFRSRYLDRRLFLTRKDYMGTGPWTVQKGDVVMLVAGAYVLYIFRPSYKGRNTWELVGEAYCHGFMAGEGLKLENLKWDTIEIV